MKKNYIKYLLLPVLCVVANTHAWAQLTVTGQLRTRSEYRDGQGSPLPKEAKPGFFTSQRTRLSLGYSSYRLKFGISAQDVRVWGQDVSTINRSTTQDNNGLMLHEAWAEILLTDTARKSETLSVKLGRQELIYDDSRLIGNLDWQQQARRHDAVLLKYERKSWTLHLAAAFNQNKENSSGTVYNSTPAGNYSASTNGGAMYKSMQFLYASNKLKKGSVSFLFFSDQFSKFHNDTANSILVKSFETGTWPRLTTGIYFSNLLGKVNLTASAYHQFGKNAAGQKINSNLLSAAVLYNISKKISAGPGIDYTSGGNNGSVSNTFDPLYGTPHKFWGLMDYFYAASGFGKSGLVDYYLKSRWKASDKLSMTGDLHQFTSATKVSVTSNPAGNRKNFGTEIDLVATATITREIAVEGGYSHFFSTPLLVSANVKNVTNARLNSNWVYLMVIIKPEFLIK